jgi:hypothetical protein
LTYTVDKLLEAEDEAFLRYSRLKKGVAKTTEDKVFFDLLPFSEKTSFADMNYLFLNNTYVMGMPMENISHFDGANSYISAYLAHDELHAVATLSSFGSRRTLLYAVYNVTVATENEPIRRRLLEYLFWTIWHEQTQFGQYFGKGQLEPDQRRRYQSELASFASLAMNSYFRNEMTSHEELFGSQRPTLSDFTILVDELTDSMALPRILHR